MATKKKAQKKKTNSRKKRVARRKTRIAASRNSRKVSMKAKTTQSKAKARPVKRTSAKSTRPRKATGKGKTPREEVRVFRSSIPTRGESESAETLNFKTAGLGANSGGQSGDLQGLSNVERADSESVDELLEEGNAFEAEVVKGVQDAPDADQGEVRTHQQREEDITEDFNEH